jgi:hypothetical protein
MHPSLSWNVGTASGRTVNQKRDARFCPANRLGDYKREQNYWLIIVALSSWQNRMGVRHTNEYLDGFFFWG